MAPLKNGFHTLFRQFVSQKWRPPLFRLHGNILLQPHLPKSSLVNPQNDLPSDGKAQLLPRPRHAQLQRGKLKLRTPIAGLIEPLHLQHYGDEFAEMKELKSRLGWSSVGEVGKFYDHKGTDTWYHYVYGQPNGKKEGKSKNEAVSRACHQGNDIYGDVAVIRSGPGCGPSGEQQVFTASWLAKSLDFYKTNNARDVFAKRERSRFQGKMGF
ncbi:MAG: hypothetical protein L6R42_006165 [Xanthoria sp. 1 TBL-2021]|nr:MAG: hypothetical protein L6R42_006165 [Xanthoria sp. 1 TBL-2021]